MIKTILLILSWLALISATERQPDNDINSRKIRHGPQYSILCPRLMVAGKPLVVSVSLLRLEDVEAGEEGTVLVRVSLRRGENRVEEVEAEVRLGDTVDISVPVPPHLGTAAHHSYSLEVVGEHLYRLEAKIFHEIIALRPWRPGHIITTSLPPLVRPGDQLWTEISVQHTDLTPYQGPVTVSLLSPAGDLVSKETLQMRGAALTSQSWETRSPRNSSSMMFRCQLDRRAPTGQWSVLVSTELASDRRSVRVLSHSPARLEVRLITPALVSSSQSSITGVVTANYTNTGLPVCGNITITAIVSDINGTVLLTKELQQPDWTDINTGASSGLSVDKIARDQLRKHFYSLNTNSVIHYEILIKSERELKVKIVAKVGELCTGQIHSGWSSVLVRQPRVHLRFVGPQHKVIDPHLTFTTIILAELDSLDSLETAVVSVETTVVLRTGSQVRLSSVEKLKEPGLGVAAWRHSSSLRSELRDLQVEAGEVRGLVVTATYNDTIITTSASMFLAVGRARPRLQLSTSTREPRVGSNAVFHVRSNQDVRLVHYSVLSAGRVTETGSLHLGSFNIRTFHLTLNASMVPLASLLVWSTDTAGNIITHFINIPVYPHQSQSGEADLARLELSLLSDQVKVKEEEEEEEEEERVGDCPPGLYWCRDTCYSHSVCYQSTTQTPDSELTETNIISGMCQDSQPEQSQGGLKVKIIGPSECKVGEEIGLEVVVESEGEEGREETVEIVMVPSHQYQVSQSVSQVRVAGGQRRSLKVWVEVRSQGEVRLELRVRGVRHQHLLQAVSPGNTVTQHTSLLVDLTHHNTWTQHHLAINNNTLNTIVTLSVTGDILGPLILQHIKPALSLMLSHYTYRRHKQLRLEPGLQERMAASFQQILSCKHPEGGFTVHFNTRTRSVWLTGLAMRTLLAASDLSPHLLTIQPALLESSLAWIMSLQETDGSFQEREMFPDPSQAPVELQTISVTAELLTSLVQLRNNNQFAGESARLGEVVEAASQWLSQQLTEIDRDPHPHDLAVVAHSLHTAGSPSSEAAFQLLSKYRVESGEMMFWGGEDGEDHQRTVVVEDEVRLVANPVICCQSLSVRATALALLTYTARRERLSLAIVRWLHSRRGGHNTWTDGVSSALATQALSFFALNTETEETSLAVRLDMKEREGRVRTSYLTINPLEMWQVVERSGQGGVMTVTVQGRGQAVVQMSQQYQAGISSSPVTAYSLEVRTGPRSLTSCHSWLCPYQTGLSGPALLTVLLPTGWKVEQAALTNTGAEMVNSSVLLTYTSLSPAITCLTLPLYQETPVRQLHPMVLVRLESVLASEHFVERMVNIDTKGVRRSDQDCRHCQQLTSQASIVSVTTITTITNLLLVTSVIFILF